MIKVCHSVVFDCIGDYSICFKGYQRDNSLNKVQYLIKLNILSESLSLYKRLKKQPIQELNLTWEGTQSILFNDVATRLIQGDNPILITASNTSLIIINIHGIQQGQVGRVSREVELRRMLLLPESQTSLVRKEHSDCSEAVS